MSIDSIKKHYSTVFITLVSILLGITLGDLVSVFRTVEEPSTFTWLTLVYTVIIIMNAWVSYSMYAISVELIPTPADAVNVFAITAAHFGLNAFIGKPPHLFFYAIAVYCLISFCTVYFMVWRATQDKTKNYTVKPYYKALTVNIIGAIVALGFGYVSKHEIFSSTIENLIFSSGFSLPVIWVILFWRTWRMQINNTASR